MAKKSLSFVVQKHDATTLHYDFRLEIDGVLKSWAIPKGPSKDPSDKRLAVPTSDHNLEYKDFEGVIPEGQYGAGKVTIWDKGTYENIRDDVSMAKAYKEGKIKIALKGKKLKGNYSLIKMHGKDKPWLLIKMQSA
jgi:DNA ligase D-like protein (predicted 3'-phosphoesterase)